jgi:glyoxylase-like metal-dependent hydrolase (beta-lactamase superfamily II)
MGLGIVDVRAIPGDSAFLIDDGKTSILYDTGFAFTGDRVADNISRILGERSLDFIFLTHSHYDHVLGTPYILRRYPMAKVVAGSYTKDVFSRPTARKVMRDLDSSFAKKCGVTDYEDLIDQLKVDITVDDGDRIVCGDMEFIVVALPGHTKCSIGFYLESERLLLSTETLGVRFGRDTYIPSYLIGYKMTLDSFKRAKSLDIRAMLLPHFGLVEGDEAMESLHRSERVTMDVAQSILEIIESGGSDDDAKSYFRDSFYSEDVREVYPEDAFNLNTSIMVGLIRKELT